MTSNHLFYWTITIRCCSLLAFVFSVRSPHSRALCTHFLLISARKTGLKRLEYQVETYLFRTGETANLSSSFSLRFGGESQVSIQDDGPFRWLGTFAAAGCGTGPTASSSSPSWSCRTFARNAPTTHECSIRSQYAPSGVSRDA